MNEHTSGNLSRRQILGAAAALGAGAWLAGTAFAPGRASAATSKDQVDELRRKFFSGPVGDLVDLDGLDPDRLPDSVQIGAVNQFQLVDDYPWMAPETALPFAVAAGLKWIRNGFVYSHWDWSANQPKEILEDAVTAMQEHGIRPLFTLDYNDLVGTDKELSAPVDMVMAAVERWGTDVGAFMFSNEPGNGVWKQTYGGDYTGGEWLTRFSAHVEEASTRIKESHPDVVLINSVQVESPAIAQLRQSSPILDGICMHHYTYRHNLHAEYSPRTPDPKFTTFASSNPHFEGVMRDYRAQARMLLQQSKLQVWMTEMGIPSLSNREFPEDTLESMSEEQQAKNTARMLVLGFLTADKSFVYQLIDQGHSAARDNDNFGMVNDELQPKQGFFVLGRISALTGGRATPDPEFHTAVTDVDGEALPLHVKNVPINVAGDVYTLVKEELRAVRFTTADDRGLVAVWSTAPPRDDFEPRRTTFATNKSLGRHPVLVDPMTGESRTLHTRSDYGDGDEFELDVTDYPQFILSEG